MKKPIITTVSILVCATAFAQKSLTKAAAEKETAAALAARARTISVTAREQWEKKEFSTGSYQLKFNYKVFGDQPAGGRSLYISLHGGGGVPAAANDQQWANQLQLYKPAEGLYVAPRSPTNSWNMWHQAHVDTLLANLIQAAIVLEEVNPDKVYVMGYSAGGDGVFQLAPRLADYWAAASMMAGHPGDASAAPLRNLPFAIYAGGKDAAYNRNTLAAQWGQKMDSLAAANKGQYIHDTHIYPDMPHWMQRKDTIAVPWMASFTRNALPEQVEWVQDDVYRSQFYWLGTDTSGYKQGNSALVSRKGNTITIEKNDFPLLRIYLSDRMMDLDKPVTVLYQGKTIFRGKVKREALYIKETAERMDKALVFSACLQVKDGKVQ